MNKLNIAVVSGLVFGALIVWFLIPVLFIWSLNTLFPVLAIPYTFQTYLASMLVSSPLYALARLHIKLKD